MFSYFDFFCIIYSISFYIRKNCKIRNTTFFIRGNNNVIELKDDISAFGAEFHIEQNGNYLHIRKGTTFHGRNGYPINI